MDRIIETVPLFPRLASELCGFLRSLPAAEWERRTVLPTWRVKDVAAHLLDTALRRLSGGRDGYRPPGPRVTIDSYGDLARLVTGMADEWVHALRAVSPGVLVELLEHAEPRLFVYLSSLDPRAQARAAVAWAGEERSEVWFDVAREYTERWHHQMQIREAFGDRAIQTAELYAPVLETFMRALPFHYRAIPAAEGTVLRVEVAGVAGGTWHLVRQPGRWRLSGEPGGAVAASVKIAQESAWRIFTRFGAEEVPESDIGVEGDAGLARHVLSMACIIV